MSRQEKKRGTIRRKKDFISVGEILRHIRVMYIFFPYIKLHQEILILRLHSLFHDGVCQFLHVCRFLCSQYLLHLRLHLSLSCCLCLCLSLSPHLLQPSHTYTQITFYYINRYFDNGLTNYVCYLIRLKLS